MLEARGCSIPAILHACHELEANPLRSRYGETVEIQYLKRDPGKIVIDFIRN